MSHSIIGAELLNRIRMDSTVMLQDDALSVLIVDDSVFFMRLLAEKLEATHGMATTTATDAAEAMAELAREPVDCVVSDYQMPETTGLELYEMLETRYDIPFVLLTGEGDEEVASRAIRMGVDDYLLKGSVQIDEPLELLVNRIHNVVERHQTTRKYERLVDNSPDEISQLDVDGTVLAVNHTMARSFGVSESELVGTQLSECVPEDVAANRVEQSRRAVVAGSAVTFQDSIGMRHFHNIAVPLATAGEEDSVQLVSREITLQKHSERMLAQKSEKFAMINRIVRHDINNDVQLLMGWADLIRDNVDEEGKETLERIHDTSTHIAELTSIARDFVESLEDDSEVQLEPVALDRLLDAEVEKKQTAHDSASIVAGSLPAVTVRANQLLSSVFGNLLNNAVRHNRSVEPEVRVDCEETEHEVVVQIADNGPGVPDHRKETIFGKGKMGPESPGTGIGLHLVHTLVEQYGGEVWVEDNKPRGAVFVVELPKAAG